MDNYELISKIKHEAGTKLLSIGSALRNIDKALNDAGQSELMISETYGLKVSDAIKHCFSSLSELHEIFKKYESITNKN